MRYEMRVTAYDMLNVVCVAVVVYESDPDAPVLREPVVKSTTTVQGTGESDPTEWAKSALIAALERL